MSREDYVFKMRQTLTFFLLFSLLSFSLSDHNIQIKLEDVPTVKGPIETYDHASVYYDHRVYIFGMPGNAAAFLPVRYLNTSDINEGWQNEWSPTRPSPRDLHTATLINNKVYIFGGRTIRPFDRVFNELFLYHPDVLHMHRFIDVEGAPTPRYGHSASAVEDSLFVFGGTNGECFFNDLFAFSTATEEWRKPLSFNGPVGRGRHTSTYVGSARKLFIIGGANSEGLIPKESFVETYDLSSGRWEKITPVSTEELPEARYGHTATLIGDQILVLGGQSANKHLLSDGWLFDVKNSIWRKLDMGKIEGLSRHSAVIDENQKVYVVGGLTSEEDGESTNNQKLFLFQVFGDRNVIPQKTLEPKEEVNERREEQKRIEEESRLEEEKRRAEKTRRILEAEGLPTDRHDCRILLESRAEKIRQDGEYKARDQQTSRRLLAEKLNEEDQRFTRFATSIQEKSQKLDDVISALLNAKDSIRGSYSSVSSSLSRLTTAVTKSPEDSVHDNGVDQLRSRINSLKLEHDALEQEARQVQENLQSLTLEASRSLSSSTDGSDLSVKISRTETEVAAAIEKEEKLKKVHGILQIRLTAIQDKISQHQSRCNSLLTRVNELRARLAELEIQRSSKNSEIESVTHQIKAAEAYGQKLANKWALISQVENELAGGEQKFSTVLLQLWDLENEAKDGLLEEELDDPTINSGLGFFKKNIEKMKHIYHTKRDAHQANLLRLRSINLELVKELGLIDTEIEKLKKELADLTEELRVCDSANDFERREHEEIQREIEKNQVETRGNLDEFQKLEETLRQLRGLQDQQQEHQRRLTTAQSDANKKSQDLLELRQNIRSNVEDLYNQLDNLLVDQNRKRALEIEDLTVRQQSAHRLAADLLRKLKEPLSFFPEVRAVAENVHSSGEILGHDSDCPVCHSSQVCPDHTCPTCPVCEKSHPSTCVIEKQELDDLRKRITDLKLRLSPNHPQACA